MKFKSVISGFVFVTGLVAFGINSHAESFEEALAKAYMTNPSLEAGRAELRSVDEGVSQALSGWRPSVTLTYEAGKEYRRVGSGTDSKRNLSPRLARARITQNLYSGGQTIAAVDGAEADVLAERARLLSAEQNVLFNAGTAYLNVVRDLAVLELNQNNESVLRRQLQATRDRFEVGEVTRTDVSQAEARLSRAIADRIDSEGRVANSRATYSNIIGDAPVNLRPANALNEIPGNKDSAVSAARSRSPSVIAARFEERAAAAAVVEAFGDLLPSVDLEGTVSRTDEASTPDSRTDSSEILARLTIPLYQGGSATSSVREAKQVHGQRRKELDAAVRTAVEDATQAWENLTTARAQIKAFSDEIKSAEIALDGVKQEAQVGSRTVLDVIDAEQELLDARVSLVTAQRDEFVARMELYRGMGQLTAKDLKLPVKLYDPEKNYRDVRDKWWGLSVGNQ